MTIGVSIVHFVIKVPKLLQMIDIGYRLIKYPSSIQDGRQKSKMTLPHKTAVISRTSSRSPCLDFKHLNWNQELESVCIDYEHLERIQLGCHFTISVFRASCVCEGPRVRQVW